MMRPMKRVGRRRAASAAALLVGAALVACGGPTPTAEPAEAAETEPVDRSDAEPATPAASVGVAGALEVGPLVDAIDPMVREALRPRMIRHGKDLTDLYGALRAGQRAEVARLARAIADEPQVAEAGPPDSANAGIPRAFFDAQSTLADRAGALAAAAKPGGGDEAALARALEGLADACNGCHQPR